MSKYAAGGYAWNNPFNMEDEFGSFMRKFSEHMFEPYLSGYTLNIGCGLSTKGEVRLDIIRTQTVNIIADACHLPFADKSFDTVIIIAVLHHIPDYQQALKEAVRVSKKTVIGIEPNIFFPHLCTLRYYLGFGGERPLYINNLKRAYENEKCRLVFEKWIYGLKLLGTVTKQHDYFIRFDKVIPNFARAGWSYVYSVSGKKDPD